MRIFIDTEFIDTGKKIELISIALVKESGEYYYAVNKDCNFKLADKWVRDNVISQLPDRHEIYVMDYKDKDDIFNFSTYKYWKSLKNITKDICKFLDIEVSTSYLIRKGLRGKLDSFFIKYFKKLAPKHYTYVYKGEKEIEFWGDYCAYDYVIFCQLFGRMIDLPKGLPMYFHDIQSFKNYLGDIELPEQKEGIKHTALSDAMHVKEMFNYLYNAEYPFNFNYE